MNVLSVASKSRRVRIATSQEAASRGRTDRCLDKYIGEGHRFGHEFLQIGRLDDRVAQPLNGVETLLVRADPQNIRHWLARGPFRRWRNPPILSYPVSCRLLLLRIL